MLGWGDLYRRDTDNGLFDGGIVRWPPAGTVLIQ